jgi:hypothetical protein
MGRSRCSCVRVAAPLHARRVERLCAESIATVTLYPNRIFRTFGADHAALEASQGSTRAFRSSEPARPYICRLIAFSLLMCPSIGPLLHSVVIHSFTASKSRRSVLANWAVKRNPEAAADTIQVFSFLALRQRSMARNWRTNRRS